MCRPNEFVNNDQIDTLRDDDKGFKEIELYVDLTRQFVVDDEDIGDEDKDDDDGEDEEDIDKGKVDEDENEDGDDEGDENNDNYQ